MRRSITLWDEDKNEGGFMKTEKKSNEVNMVEVDEICQNCGHNKTTHFDTESCPINSHWQRCQRCGNTTKLYDYRNQWKVKCSCGKILKPKKNPRRSFSKVSDTSNMPCPD